MPHEKTVRLGYYASATGNVGDDLNLTLWPHFLGDMFSSDAETIFLGIGSILDQRYDGPNKKLVLGAGVRDPKTAPDLTAGNWDVRFVRGPLSAHALGLPEKVSISDPALLCPIVYPPPQKHRLTTQRRIGFIPYFRTDPIYAQLLCASADLQYIPVTLSPERFVAMLARCTHVISEAMHGAILADAYHIPWRPCRISNIHHEGLTHVFKWGDWMASIGVEADFLALPQLWANPGKNLLHNLKLLATVRDGAKLLRAQARSPHWFLSNPGEIRDRQERMLNEIDILRINGS